MAPISSFRLDFDFIDMIFSVIEPKMLAVPNFIYENCGKKRSEWNGILVLYIGVLATDITIHHVTP